MLMITSQAQMGKEIVIYRKNNREEIPRETFFACDLMYLYYPQNGDGCMTFRFHYIFVFSVEDVQEAGLF